MLDGLSRIKSLVQEAKAKGMEALAITDHGSLYGVVDFYDTCKEAGIKPIIGCEVYVAQGSRLSKTPADKSPYHMVLLAKDNEGYRNLIQLVTKSHLEGFYYKPRIDKELLEEHREGLIGLTACPNGEVPRLIIDGRMDEAKERALYYKDLFSGNFYLELQDHEQIPELETLNKGLIELHSQLDIPFVLTNDCHYVHKEDAPIQDLLVCIQTNTNVNDEKRLRMEDPSYYLRSSDEMAAIFSEYPEAYENTKRIVDQCNVEIDFSQVHLPEYKTPDHLTSMQFLTELCEKGLALRAADGGSDYRDRLAYELEVIEKTQFADYFLVVWDIAAFTRKNNILFGVRGSAAASLALFCLGVTDIDPLAYRLVFERFLNLERKEMPDIDMDFQDDRRDEVLHYVVEKYGMGHVAQIVTFGTMGPKAAIRDTGRALAMAYGEVDNVARLIPARARTLDEAIETVPELWELYQGDDTLRNLIDNAKRLEGVVRNVGTHAAGVVISKDLLSDYVPLQRPVRGDDTSVPVTQFSMEPVQKLGLLKMDFLGLSNLSILDKTLRVIEQHRSEKLDLHEVPLDDDNTFLLLSSGETTGIFQLEGLGVRRYIKELKPTSIQDVASMIALYRPGPMEHIDAFIEAKHGRVDVDYLHPVLKDILEESYGIIVYQDQVLLIAQALAGYSLGEADIVRKAMGKKVPAIMQQEKERFIQGALAQGYERQLAEQVFSLIEPFAGYAFNKAHSVSYALIAYWTAYFKANYPVEYMVALFNSYMGNQDRVAIAIDECARLKIKVLSPDINFSDLQFTIEQDQEGTAAIRLGLGAIKHVNTAGIETLVNSRKGKGFFASLDHFCRNAELDGINRRTIESLIKAGTLDSFGPRGSLLATVDRIVSLTQQESRLRESGQTTMFDLFGESVETPLHVVELIAGDEVTDREIRQWEKELIGKALSGNRLSEVVLANAYSPGMSRADLQELVGEKVSLVGQITSLQSRNTREGKTFVSCSLEIFGGTVEVVAWPNIYGRNPEIWSEGTLIQVSGKVQNRDDQIVVYANEGTEFMPETEAHTEANQERVESNHLVEATDYASQGSNGRQAHTNGYANGQGMSHGKADGTSLGQGMATTADAINEVKPGGNGRKTAKEKTLIIKMQDSGDPESDTEKLRNVVQMLLEFPGPDKVRLDIASGRRRTLVEMSFVTTSCCSELEQQLTDLGDHGIAVASE